MTAAILSLAIAGTRQAATSPVWVDFVATGVVVLVFACGPLYVWWAFNRWEQGGSDSNESEGEGDGGGGGRRGGRTPPKGSPDADPSWWPEFEQQFAAHIACHLDARDDATPAIPRNARLAIAAIRTDRRPGRGEVRLDGVVLGSERVTGDPAVLRRRPRHPSRPVWPLLELPLATERSEPPGSLEHERSQFAG
jgi:hypothetical protein